MEIYQLRSFACVARSGIVRAAEQLFLSQPAISAHIRALEDELGLQLFTHTPKGMQLSTDGHELLARAEQMLDLHRNLLDDARRRQQRLRGRVRLGSSVHSPGAPLLGRLMTHLTATSPGLELSLQHGTSRDIQQGILNGTLDGGFFVDLGLEDPRLQLIGTAHFGIFLAARRGLVSAPATLDWAHLAGLPWVCPNSSTCCGLIAESLFEEHGFRPRTLASIEQESVSRVLIAGGVGIGLLHEDVAREAEACGEVDLLGHGPLRHARLVFATLAARSAEPTIAAVLAAVEWLHAGPDERSTPAAYSHP